ncbi:hypothetical protein D9758_015962 [Tetrapyrgos nigripes]|uniref:Uncharacterized protein n=1 Tax=Tetrapyrgos nigripes TaxID=182062 RepID=A0A8H5FDV9_9AGAR|nr:hypothetical protein D9758_015962 [Tetrapyrgos nigripes]
MGEEVTRLPPSAIEIIPNTGDVVANLPPPPSTLFVRPAVERIPGRPESIDARIALSKEQTQAFNLAFEGFPLVGNIVSVREFLSPYWASITGNTGTAGNVSNLGFPTYHDMKAVRKCMQLGPDGTFIKNLGPQTFWKGLCVNTQEVLRGGAKATPHMYHVSANMTEDTAHTIRETVIGPVGVLPSSLGNLERLDWFTPFRPSVAWQTPNTAFAVHDWHFGVRVADTPSYVVHSESWIPMEADYQYSGPKNPVTFGPSSVITSESQDPRPLNPYLRPAMIGVSYLWKFGTNRANVYTALSAQDLGPVPTVAETMRFSLPSLLRITVAVATFQSVQAGLLAYGICQTGCNTLAVACYSAAGATFGTVVASAATPAAILACNAALGKCSAACAAVTLVAPTP